MKYTVMIVVSTMGGAPAEIGFADRARCESASRAVAAHVYSADCYSVERTGARPAFSCHVRRDRLGVVVVVRNTSGQTLPRGTRYAYTTRSGQVIVGRFSGTLPYRLRAGHAVRDYFSGHGIDSCDARVATYGKEPRQ